MSQDAQDSRRAIVEGDTSLGIELGSTRIKAVLIGPDHTPLATGSHSWQNSFVDGLWTYGIDEVWTGLQAAYADLAGQVRERYDVPLTTVGSLGISAMMHGYIAMDETGQLLVPFRTWRNTNTGAAVEELTAQFGYNIPHRWSVAHHYQAILDGEEHVAAVRRLTTLAGYVHGRLTGRWVLGIGDASGMFPIDDATRDYDARMLARFEELASSHPLSHSGGRVALRELLPTIQVAGDDAGSLTDEGALLLDPSGTLHPGIPMCPPEGDAGTGMVATNSVAPRTGNVSAGTSIFAMVVLERALSKVHEELDMVTTPAGDPVAMVHCNNGASELDAWAGLFRQFAGRLTGSEPAAGDVFRTLFTAALQGEADAGGVMAFNYLSGEPITGLEHGRPLVFRTPDARFDLANFMRAQIYAAFATLRIGMDVLLQDEGVPLDVMFAHGGVFGTKGVAQRLLAAAIDTPVSVGDVAAEGGAWGIAVLAAYLRRAEAAQSLADFLADEVLADAQLETIEPDPDDVAGFAAFMKRYVAAIPVVRTAAELD